MNRPDHPPIHPMDRRGVVLIALIVIITIMGVLGSAIYALRTTASHGVIQASHQNRAWVLAESGLRYALSEDFAPNKAYTVVAGADGLLRRYPAATAPPVIDTSGFRVSQTACGIVSTGVVWENSPFEASQTIPYEYPGGMPAWAFNSAPTGGIFEDGVGANRVRPVGPEGPAWSWSSCAANARGALVFSGGYAVTDFRPHCELKALQEFTIVAIARPDDISGLASLLEVSEADKWRFGIDIMHGYWTWAYGNQRSSMLQPIPVSDIGRWQRIIVRFNGVHIFMRIDGCGITPYEDSFFYAGDGVLPASLADNRLYIGAKNESGSPIWRFRGAVDSVTIYDHDVGTSDPPLPCQGHDAMAYFPLNGDIANQGSASTITAVASGGAAFGTDRFSCLDSALSLDGLNDALDAPPPSTPPSPTPPLVAGYPFSLAAWVRVPLAPPSGDHLAMGLVHAASSDDRFGVVVDGDASARVCLHTQSDAGNANRECATGVAGLADGLWHHLSATWTDPGQRRLYLDGQAVTLTPTDSAPDAVVIDSPPDRLSLGRWGDAAGGPYFRGDMDDVAVYDRALSVEEIQNIFREGTP